MTDDTQALVAALLTHAAASLQGTDEYRRDEVLKMYSAMLQRLNEPPRGPRF